MIEGKLPLGLVLELTCPHSYPLVMSDYGGADVSDKLEVEAGTKVRVTEDCDEWIVDIPFHFVDPKLKERVNGQPFFAVRFFLRE